MILWQSNHIQTAMNRPNLGRRRFLASSAALAGAALLSPSLLAAAPAKKLTGVNETTLSTVEQEIRAMAKKPEWQLQQPAMEAQPASLPAPRKRGR